MRYLLSFALSFAPVFGAGAEPPCRDERGAFIKCPTPAEVEAVVLAEEAIKAESQPATGGADAAAKEKLTAPGNGDSAGEGLAESPSRAPVVSLIVGYMGSVGTEAKIKPNPLARVLVDWLVWGDEHPLYAHVSADISALPDSEIRLDNANTFNDLELAFAARYKPLSDVSASVYAEGGFASRFTRGTVEPVTSAPLWSSYGLYFEDKGEHRGRLKLGMGPDERLGYGWTLAAHVTGQLRLVNKQEIGSTLLVSAILGLENNPTGQRVNVIRAGVGLSWDTKNSKDSK